MKDILMNIQENLELVITIITTIGALITAAIIQYKRVKDAAMGIFESTASAYSMKAETAPMSVLGAIKDKSEIPMVDKGNADTNESKALIVAAATNEALKSQGKKNVLQKLGINNVFDAVPLVSTIYQDIVKPLVVKK